MQCVQPWTVAEPCAPAHSPANRSPPLQVSADPQGPEAVAYRLWVAEVLQPLNEQAAAIVRDHIDQVRCGCVFVRRQLCLPAWR